MNKNIFKHAEHAQLAEHAQHVEHSQHAEHANHVNPANNINKKIVDVFNINHKYKDSSVILVFWSIIVILGILIIIIVICTSLKKNDSSNAANANAANANAANADKISQECLSHAKKLWHTDAFFPRTEYSLSVHNNFLVKSNKSIISGAYLNNTEYIIMYTYTNAKNCPASTVSGNYTVYSTIIPKTINCQGGSACAVKRCKINNVKTACNNVCITGINTTSGRCTTTKTAKNAAQFVPSATCASAVKAWKTCAGEYCKTQYTVSVLNNYAMKSNISVISGYYVGGASTKFMHYTYKNAGNCPAHTVSGNRTVHSTTIPDTINCQGGIACASSGCTLNALNTGCNRKCIAGINTAHGFCTTTTKNNPMLQK